MITETTVRLASKLYEMRDGAKLLLGDRYLERMAEYRKVIEIVQSKLKIDNPIAAATDICQHVDGGGFEVIFIMAAACEMVEPSSPQQGKDGG